LTRFVAVVGEKERSSETVNVRTRDNIVHGEIGIKELIEKFKTLQDTYAQREDSF
jgi:threonyl-tRNA synthetase